MLKNMKKKKKGFTLIELVIVLAVLAIIALIAIPNFTKVRNDSLLKSDFRSAEQIRKITLMAISNETVPDTAAKYTLTFSGKNFASASGPADTTQKADFEAMLKDVKAPQMTPPTAGTPLTFVIDVTAGGVVTVSYSEAVGSNTTLAK